MKKRFVSLHHALCALALLALLPTASAQPEFSSCITSLQRELPRYPKVRAQTFAKLTQQAQDLRPPIDKASRSQPEFTLAIWDYLARLVDAERISDGKVVLGQQAAALQRITSKYRIDPATVVAVLGVESDFGRLQGRHAVIDATLSRACLRLSSRDRKAQFFAALWLVQEGLVNPENFHGSWAGAFGMTQFMPATYTQYMADGDSDGAIDTVASMADALATTANYLKGLGWDDALPWGIEVTAPQGVASSMNSSEGEHACLRKSSASGRCRQFAQWAGLGVKRVDGTPLLDSHGSAGGLRSSTPAALLAPAGANGPIWLVTRNFQALWQYNHADTYALAIGLLASTLRGESPIVKPWPSAEAGLALSRAGILALQTALRDGGQCDIDADGFDGPMTRQAIRDEERRRGLPESGRPTTTLLELLRTQPKTPAAKCPVQASKLDSTTEPKQSNNQK